MRTGLGLLLALLLGLPVGAADPPVPGLSTPKKKPTFASPDHEWAVLVGVCSYLHLPKTLWLDGCDLDATALAHYLESPRGGAFPPDHVKLLVNEAATTSALRMALDFLIKHAGPGDVVYLFFACHGKVEVYGGGEVAYLLPYDADPQFLNATALPMDELRRYVDVNLRQAGQVVLITDACHAGSLSVREDLNRSSVLGSVSDHLLDIGVRDGVLNIMACRRDESSLEDPRLGGHGVLTYALLKALSGDGDTAPDGTVRAQDVLEYVMRLVPRLTEQSQHPRHSSNYSDEFPMARLSLKGPDLDLPPIPSNLVRSVDPTSVQSVEPGSLSTGPVAAASLRVVGAPRDSELYLVQGRDQRTVGRVLDGANVLVVDGLSPGHYTLVQSLAGKTTQWPIELSPGLHSFDIQAGQIQ